MKRARESSPYDRVILLGKAIPFGDAVHADLPGSISRLFAASNLFSADLRPHYFPPFPGLRRITLVSPLSAETAGALAAISSAPVLKMQRVFPERFCERQGWNDNLATDLLLKVWHTTEGSRPRVGS